VNSKKSAEEEFSAGANHMGNNCGRNGMARLGPAVRAEKHRFDAMQVIQNNVEKESNPTSMILSLISSKIYQTDSHFISLCSPHNISYQYQLYTSG
jgi:hypothetical protein